MNLSTLNPNELVGPSGRNVQSAYFDGNGDYLSLASSSQLDLVSGNFTIEVWFYVNSFSASNRTIFSKDGQSGVSYSQYSLGMNSAGALGFGVGSGNGISYIQGISAGTAVLRSWMHAAFVKDGTTLSSYLNGVLQTSATQTGTITTGNKPLIVGWEQGQPATHYFDGYLSGLRIVKGTALYTSNFTPPTAPLTPITNTSFLLGFSEYRFIDQSPNNFTITKNGDTSSDTFSPYGDNWSNYFDGTGDYLSVAATTNLNLSSGNWTVECWWYPLSNVTQNPIMINYNAGTDGYAHARIGCGTSPNTFSALSSITGNVWISTATGGSWSVGNWYHLAFVRNGSSFTLYVNGTSVLNYSNPSNLFAGNGISEIGRTSSSVSNFFYVNGYVADARVVKGTAVYTSNFTPPTAPLTAIPNTSLLTCQSNRFLDASTNNFAITRNGDVSVQPYGPFPAPVPDPVVDIYTTTGVANTWIKRPGAKAVQMIAIGAGGGGGGGMGSATAVQRNGGGGGGGGANGQIIYTADQLPSTLYIRVGAGGSGGASNVAGAAGGNSTIAAADPITSSTSVYCMGGGGGGGEQGAASSSTVGGGGGGTAGAGTTGTGENPVSGGFPALGAGFYTGGGGAGGGNGAAATTAYAAEWGGGGGGGVRSDGANRQPGAGSLYGGAGGGVGGFLNSAGAGNDGVCGGASGRYTFGNDQASFGGGAAGIGSAGGAGANATTLYAAGSGGGGGGVSGFAGGAGGFPGGGGGGGGASATTGGTGGAGGAGRVVLVTFF